MKQEDIESGEVYYICLPSIESEGYGDNTPRSPYRAKAEWVQNPGGLVLYMRRFDRETGEVDQDSNATAIAIPEQVFPDEESALVHYKELARAHAKGLQEEAAALLASIGEPESMELPPGDKANYETIKRAALDGNLALISAVRKADRARVSLLCAMSRIRGQSDLRPMPLAVMIEDNPFELFEDPTIPSPRR